MTENEWIPVSVELPERGTDVLVSLLTGSVMSVYYTLFGDWEDSEGYVLDEPVKAWMPLPEPYDGE